MPGVSQAVLDFPKTMRRAMDLHVRGKWSEAETLYRQVLQEMPAQFDALHNLGVLLLQRGDTTTALDCLRRASEINPQSASAHLNIGSALRSLDRTEEALAHYNLALSIKPAYAEAYNNKGVALRQLGRFMEAIESYDQALKIKPTYADAHNNRATVWREDLKNNEEALASAEQAITLNPRDPDAHLNRAHALHAFKRHAEAIASYREALACGGDRELLNYYLGALGAESTPKTSPRRYVESLFDQYAPRFDQSLLGLKYGIPEQLFSVVTSVSPDGMRDIADLGCGTGLCGPLFRPIARKLVGVDLSASMLGKASERAVYDQLIKSELVNFLNDHSQSFDLIIATDVFIYVGDLEAVFAAAKRALRPGGQFAFSVESHDGEGYAIRPSRRFAHSLPYLRSLAEKNGFQERKTIAVAVRQEEGQDIAGHIAVLESR
jgi:predicted TPR repeat methyltransferase